MSRQDSIQGKLQSADLGASIYFLEEFANHGLVGLDEAQKAVGIFGVVGAANPKRKLFIFHIKVPTPILRRRLIGFKSFPAKSLHKKLRQTLPK